MVTTLADAIVKLNAVRNEGQYFATVLSIRGEKRSSYQADMGKRLITGNRTGSGAGTEASSVPNIY